MKKVVLVLIPVFFLSACGSIQMRDFSKGLEIGENIYTNYTFWSCRDYMNDGDIALEIVKTDVTWGDSIDDDIKNMHKKMQEDEKLGKDEKVKEVAGAMRKLHASLKQIKQGFILFDGGKEFAEAMYTREGINHRWDWGKSKFSFVIKPDGTGLYYDFTNVKEDESTKARDVFKCNRDFSNID